MSKTENQEKAFSFLRHKFDSQELFTAQHFQEETGFSAVSFKTYMSKQYRGLLIPVTADSYRVSAVFRQFSTWKKFRDKVATQNRNFGRKYTHVPVDEVVIFEFYMPLRNEEYLRQTLDSLFYKDTILFRLRLVDKTAVDYQFPKAAGETYDQQLDRVCSFAADKFVGYSIHHVNGRFRSGLLMIQADGKKADRYLVDESTAVVRFILPCVSQNGKTPKEVAALTRWCFNQLFVQSILEVVNAEDEIWLLESGMEHKLHIWRAEEP